MQDYIKNLSQKQKIVITLEKKYKIAANVEI